VLDDTGRLTSHGGMQLATYAQRPLCQAESRGTFWIALGGNGQADSLMVCVKAATDAYGWRTVF
jgi:hypothetical protein